MLRSCENRQIAATHAIDALRHAERVSGLADRPGNISDHRLTAWTDCMETMIGVVKRRSGQIIHGGIDDHEWTGRTWLDPDDAGEQHARRSGNDAPEEHRLACGLAVEASI
jgi:hypothetical protein